MAKDRKLARVYGAGGIPSTGFQRSQTRLEVYENPIGGQYPAPTMLGEAGSVDLVIDGQIAGRIPVADLLPYITEAMMKPAELRRSVMATPT